MRILSALTSASVALAAAGVGAVATLGLALVMAPPAAAAPCSGTSGVTAVVDFNQLGGGVTAGCAPDGHGDVALRVFDEAGYTQQAHPEMGHFVCRIEGRPAAGEPCAEEDAFWSLWWSDGESGEWVFSQQGASSLRLRDGWYVAWSWHEGTGKATPPDVVPTSHEEPETTEPTSKPTAKPTKKPNGGGDSNGGGNGGDEGRGTDRGDTSGATGPSSTGSTAPTDPTTGATETADGDPIGRSGRKGGKSDKQDDGAGAAEETVRPAPSSVRSSDLPQIDEITAGPPGAADDDASGGMSAGTIAAIGAGVLVLGAAGAVPLLRRRRA